MANGMISGLCRAAVLLALLAGLASPATAADDAALSAVIDRAQASGFAGEVLVTDARDVTFARAVSASGRPHHRGELWRWASVSKQVTAVLVMQQVEAGRLSLDDTLAKRLPGFSGATGGEVTIRMLLQHTSGLPNPDDTPAATPASFPDFYRRAAPANDALSYCAGKARARPGEGFNYNNCDYIVLGAVLEHLTGARFDQALNDKIAKPAGLSTLAMATPGHAGTVAGSMEKGEPEPPFELATFGAAGAMVGVSDDLARFDRALLSGRLLSETARATLWAGDPKLGYVALGAWGFAAPLKGCNGAVSLVERRGEIGGVEVRNLIAPELGLALIVFADRAGLDFGEVWQGKGLTFDLASAAFCPKA